MNMNQKIANYFSCLAHIRHVCTFFVLLVFWKSCIFAANKSINMKMISNEKEYNAIVKRIDELLEIVTDENYNSAPEAIELDFLSELVEEYENKYYPIMQQSKNKPVMSAVAV